MKRPRQPHASVILIALALSLAAELPALAGPDNPKSARPAKKPSAFRRVKVRPPPRTELVEVTGSRLRQDKATSGPVSRMALPVTIIDEETIKRLGATSVSQILARYPGGH